MKPEAKSDPEKTLSPQARATFSRAPYVHCWKNLTQQEHVTRLAPAAQWTYVHCWRMRTQRGRSFDLLWVEQSKRLVSTR